VLKIVDNLMPAVIKAVEFAATILKPFLDAIKAILDGLAYITGSGPSQALATAGAARPAQVAAGLAAGGGAGLARGGMVPMSPQLSTMSTSTTSTSKVDIQVGNLPPGSTVKQDKPAPGVTLNTGRTVGSRM